MPGDERKTRREGEFIGVAFVFAEHRGARLFRAVIKQRDHEDSFALLRRQSARRQLGGLVGWQLRNDWRDSWKRNGSAGWASRLSIGPSTPMAIAANAPRAEKGRLLLFMATRFLSSLAVSTLQPRAAIARSALHISIATAVLSPISLPGLAPAQASAQKTPCSRMRAS